ncbi:MAG TPA: carboxypeptidase regulatory-like domain-containing protein [Bryobacteraceae bacterium]|nr:carboxypeptidase regulatory-like domain-containing protein [Bryobacteraceae bacterium]
MTTISRIGAALLLCAGLLVAQTNRGGITGTVFDETGAVVPNAVVTIKNAGTNQAIQAKTSLAGAYSVLSLDPVIYSVTVEAPGFKKSTVSNIKVDTATVATVNVTLQAGAVSTEVTVQAESAMINTESGTTSSTVTEREIDGLPLVNRSVLDLALSQPNVSGDAGSENPAIVTVTTCPGCNLSVNGGRPLNTLMLADGTNNTGVSLARTMVSFSPETVQEFTVQTSAYSAEYGTTGGGVINATTKSGTNELTGTALWYNRNPDLAAAPYTLASTNRSPPSLKYNQFSLAAGGPVYIPKVYNGKNRTFWFAAFEPFYRRDFLAQDTIIPTDAMRQGDWSNTVATAQGTLPADVAQQFGIPSNGDATIYDQYSLTGNNQFTQLPAPATGTTYLPFPGNIIPKTMLDSTYLKTLPYYAEPGAYYIGANGTIENLYNPRLLSQDEKRYTLKIDQMVNDYHHLSFRYTATPIIKTQMTPTSPTSNNAEYSYAKQAMLAYTWTISPTLMNDLRLDFTRGNFSNTTAPQWDPQTGENLNTELGLPSIMPGGLPSLPDIGGQGSTENQDHEQRFGITDIFYKNTGKMSWKFGVDLSRSFQNVIPLYGAIGGVYSFSTTQTCSTGASGCTGGNSFASFELGVPSKLTIRSVTIPYYYRWNAAAGFVQNDWKVKPNLTLNLGIRYNLELPRTEKYDSQGVFMPQLAKSYPLAAPLTLADGEVISSVTVPPFAYAGHSGVSKYLLPPDYMDFEPRFGFAWSPGFLREHRVTVRGGYGLAHAPVSGANRLPTPDFSNTNSAYSPTTGQQNTNYIMRLGENPPVLDAIPPAQAIGAPSDGLLYMNSTNSSLNMLGIGYAVSPNYHTPYVQNWNLTISWQLNQSTALEISYVGNKGTHLFMPREDINPRDVNLLNAEDAANISTTTANYPDPLGRVASNGKVINIQQGTLGSRYLGFSTLYMLYDASGDSIRNGAYVSLMHRVARGLTFTANYTFAKSIDDASSSGGDKNVLTPVGGQVDGQVAFGGLRSLDRSVSTYDQTHVFNSTFIYDMPFGHGRRFLTNAWRPLDFIAGGWTMSGVIHANSGFPAMVTLSDTNQLGDPAETHTLRPDIVPGVPLVNPLYSSSCPIGGNCQPYLNPSAFQRPPIGQLGDAPRTLPWVRGPWAENFDASIQKNFKIGEKRRIQFRVDLLNAFNHPVFRVYPNNAGGVDLMGAPSTGTLSTAQYNSWASANGQPASTTTAGLAQYNQIVANVNSFRVNNVLPANFFSVPLPANFWGTAANSFDIRTTEGYKYYQLRNTFNAAGFGRLYQAGQPRYIQLGLKIYF